MPNTPASPPLNSLKNEIIHAWKCFNVAELNQQKILKDYQLSQIPEYSWLLGLAAITFSHKARQVWTVK